MTYLDSNLQDQYFDWDRRWGRREGPGGILAVSNTSRPLRFDEIADANCLILLGPPGIGKTETVKAQYHAIEAKNNSATDDKSLYFDLGAYDASELIVQRIFQDSRYQAWKAGTYRLHLFLDSLDEGLLKVSSAASLIADELRAAPLERLFLRIVCRTADWPGYLKRELQDCWPSDKDTVQVYELIPLTHEEIALAVIKSKIDFDEFFSEVERVDALPLAERPVTLRFLIDRFQNVQQLPATREELYREGCLQLCSEINERRRLYYKARNQEIDPYKRFNVASRIAAVMMFSNRYSVYVGTDRGQLRPTDLNIEDILSATPNIDKNLVEDSLSSQLFTDDGYGRRTLTHRTFGEYLAAAHIFQLKLPTKVVLPLLTTKNGDFIPKLYETLRWLAEMDSNIFREVIKRSPEILLRVDDRRLSVKLDALRQRPSDFLDFLKSLLKSHDNHLFLYLRESIYFGKLDLNHPELAQSLRPYLERTDPLIFRRQFILMLIEKYDLPGFDNQLLTIVTDKSQDQVARRMAMGIIYDTGKPETRQRLKPLISGGKDDPDDELKGGALLSLWPDFISSEELFRVLLPPKRESFLGFYSLFLSTDRVITPLKLNDLPIALKWVEQQPRMHEQAYALRNLVDGIMQKAWININDPEILEAFTSAVVSRLAKHDNIFGVDYQYRSHMSESLQEFIRAFYEAKVERYRLIENIVPIALKSNIHPVSFIFSHPALVLREDLFWLIERMEGEADESTQETWATLIERVFNRNDPKHLEAVYNATLKNPILAAKVSQYFEPIQPDASPSITLKKDIFTLESVIKSQAAEDFDTDEILKLYNLIDDTLRTIEAGNINDWITFALHVILQNDHGAEHNYGFDPDLTIFPGWQNADIATRNRIINVANKFVRFYQPKDEVWITTGKIPYSDLAGYLALFLLLKHDSTALATLNAHDWAKWTQVVAWHPIQTSQEDETLQRKLISLAYQQSGDTLIKYIKALIDVDNNKHQSILNLEKFNHIQDRKFNEFLLSQAQRNDLAFGSFNILFAQLLAQHDEAGEAYTIQVLREGYVDGTDKGKFIAAIVSLATFAASKHWPIIWGAIENNNEVAIAVMERLGDSDHRHGNLALQLTDSELATLFGWLEERYPHETDPQIDGFHVVSTREEIGRWRNNLLTELQGRGTSISRREIIRLAEKFPNHLSLQIYAVEAKIMPDWDADWEPATPQTIFSLSRPHANRVSNWTRDQKIAIIGLIITLIISTITCAIQVIVPELRASLGLNSEIEATPTQTQIATFETTVPNIRFEQTEVPSTGDTSEITLTTQPSIIYLSPEATIDLTTKH